MIRRRALIGGCVGAVAAVSGCFGRLNDLRYRITDDFARRVSIADVDSAPEDFPLEFDITVTAETISADRYGTLEIATTNRSESTRETQIPIYKGASDAAGEPGILLYAAATPDGPSTEGGPECSTSEEVRWTLEGRPTVDLEPGETMVDEFVIADDPSVTGCFPVGEYRFEGLFSADDGTGRTIRGGLTIRLADE